MLFAGAEMKTPNQIRLEGGEYLTRERLVNSRPYEENNRTTDATEEQLDWIWATTVGTGFVC